MKYNEEDIVKFLGTTAQSCAVLIQAKEDFCFDIKFQVGKKIYRLTLAEQKTENDYLKDN